MPSTASSGSVLGDYLRAYVAVYYVGTSGLADNGRVTYMDDTWIELSKENHDRLLIPVQSIRLIKLLEPGKPQGEAGTLLRPAEDPPVKEPRDH